MISILFDVDRVYEVKVDNPKYNFILTKTFSDGSKLEYKVHHKLTNTYNLDYDTFSKGLHAEKSGIFTVFCEKNSPAETHVRTFITLPIVKEEVDKIVEELKNPHIVLVPIHSYQTFITYTERQSVLRYIFREIIKQVVINPQQLANSITIYEHKVCELSNTKNKYLETISIKLKNLNGAFNKKKKEI